MQAQQLKQRRRRGIILTAQGLEKLQQAKAEAEFEENAGHRYTLEALSDRTGLGVDTLMKVFACESGVDKQTLKCCFSGFNLVLEKSDYYYPEPPIALEEPSQKSSTELVREPELPEGQVPLESAFYIEREPIESDCYRAIRQPGALIRIKAPRRLGKTSLMTRILHQAAQEGYRTVSLSFQLADKAILQDLDKFLQWFCANVSLGLGLPNRLVDYWDELFGSKISCKIYFEQYLLAKINQPLVLALDDVEKLFEYPELADEFFALLRAWHEEGKNREIWKKVHLIVVHSSEVYIALNINKSPFNVGLPIELPEFNCDQIQYLVKQYQLNWSDKEIEQLMELVGGNPYLVRLALYHIWHQDITLEQLLNQPPDSDMSIYREHLRRQLWHLQTQDSELVEALAQVVIATTPVELDLVKAFKLQSLGLVRLQGTQAKPSCQLYAQYFRNYFNS